MFSVEQLSQWLIAAMSMLFLAVFSFAVGYIRGIGKRMQEIAEKMTELVAKDKVHDERHENVDDRLEDHEQRIRYVEARH